MTEITNNNENNPTQVFVGTPWEVALVQSLLENAEVKSFVYYGGRGAMAPWVSRGCFPLNRIIVSSEDYEKAKLVVDQFYDAMKEDASS